MAATPKVTLETCINTIEASTQRISDLAIRARDAVQVEQERVIRAAIDAAAREASDCAASAKRLFKDMVNDNSSSKSELRRLLNRYTEVVKDHIRAKEAYKTQVRESMVRTAQLLGVSDKELLAHPEGFMRSAIMDSMATGEAESVYSATLQRERDVQNLEHSVVELCGLFNDVAMLIDQQALDLNTISANIQSANTHVERGKTQIQEATRYQVRHRKRMTCCLCIAVMVIMAIIVIPTVLLTTN